MSCAWLPTLQVLLLDHNQLSHLPEEVCQLEALQTLDVAHNRLDTLPLGLCSLLNLTHLHLEGNPLGGTIAPGITIRGVYDRVCGASSGSSSSSSSSSSVGSTAAGGQSAGLAGSSADAQEAAEADGQGGGSKAAGTSTAAAPSPSAATSSRQQQAVADCTEAVLAMLLEALPADQAAAVKQRKYTLLMQAARDKVSRMIMVADYKQIESCVLVAEGAGERAQARAALHGMMCPDAGMCGLQAYVPSAEV
jgi:hypothetical protein